MRRRGGGGGGGEKEKEKERRRGGGGHSLERDGDVSEGLVTEGVSDLLPDQAGVQQLPLPVRQIVLKIHVTGSVGYVHLGKYWNIFSTF